MKLSIVVPCYNEEENVQLFYKKTVEALGSIYYNTEIIFVNDGSEDHTLKKLKELYNYDSLHVKVVDFSRNFGKEAALLAGLKQSKGDFVSIIDADLQQNPRYIVDMLTYLQDHQDFDCVAAYQDVRKEGKAITCLKNCFYKIINKMTEIEFVSSASDFRMLRRNVVNAIVSLPERCRFSKGIFSWVGFNTYYMPYTVEDRAHGKSKWSFYKLFAYAIEGIVSFSTKPLVLAFATGTIFCVLSFLLMLIAFIQICLLGNHLDELFFATLLIFFALGVQLIFLGIFGQYLANAYTEAKHRPVYIVKEILEAKKEDEK